MNDEVSLHVSTVDTVVCVQQMTEVSVCKKCRLFASNERQRISIFKVEVQLLVPWNLCKKGRAFHYCLTNNECYFNLERR